MRNGPVMSHGSVSDPVLLFAVHARLTSLFALRQMPDVHPCWQALFAASQTTEQFGGAVEARAEEHALTQASKFASTKPCEPQELSHDVAAATQACDSATTISTTTISTTIITRQQQEASSLWKAAFGKQQAGLEDTHKNGEQGGKQGEREWRELALVRHKQRHRQHSLAPKMLCMDCGGECISFEASISGFIFFGGWEQNKTKHTDAHTHAHTHHTSRTHTHIHTHTRTEKDGSAGASLWVIVLDNAPMHLVQVIPHLSNELQHTNTHTHGEEGGGE